MRQVFISYSRKDKTHKDRLVNELRILEPMEVAASWHDQKIAGGKPFKEQIFEAIDRADIFLALVSPNFVTSKYCKLELDRASERFRRGDCRVLPILIRDAVGWDVIRIGKALLGSLQAVPSNGVPVTQWSHPEDAWRAVLRGITEVAAGAGGASNLEEVRNQTLSSIGVFAFDSIANFFDLDAWQHYYPGDHDAEVNLQGEVEVVPSANRLTLNGYDDEFETLQTVAVIDYEPQIHRFRYSRTQPGPSSEQYHFDLMIPVLGGITVKATRFDSAALEVGEELTLLGLLKFLRRVFRQQKKKYRNR